MAWSRRAFIVGSAAVCIGCGSDSEPEVPVAGGESSTTAPPTSRPTDDTVPDDAVPEDVGPGFRSADLGPIAEVTAEIERNGGFLHRPDIRAWVVRIPDESLADVEDVYGEPGDAGMAAGFVALYQKCTHLGCRVPECVQSGRFECPCHGSVFNHIGEWVVGPAPRGLDRFAVSIVDDRVVVDASTTITGSARGVSTVSGEVPAGGSACIPGAEAAG